jgi:hypothetical protein
MTGTVTPNGAHIDTPFDPPATQAQVQAIADTMTSAGATNVQVKANPNVPGGWIIAADWVLPKS